MVYPEKYCHYDFQKNVVSQSMEYFPQQASDIIKLIYMFRDKRIVIKQFGLSGHNFVQDLKTHLGFEWSEITLLSDQSFLFFSSKQMTFIYDKLNEQAVMKGTQTPLIQIIIPADIKEY